ncbi:MAG TPA: hypothetical protein VFV50_03965 [Bdellovibrionales bacterium]|nr:hypothetical protein [Bdellovibrionales bacterium]
MRSQGTSWHSIALLIVLLTGCATGFSRKALEEQVGVASPEFNESDIKTAYEKRPNLPKPFKLGVYFKTPSYARSAYDPSPAIARDWRWSEKDKAFLDGVAADLKQRGLIADVFPLVSSVVGSDDLKALRLVAAKHQADAILIVSGAADVDRYANNWAITYLLLAPALFIPGSQADTLFLASATMWDVKNEYLYMTAEAEGFAHDKYAAAFGRSNKELIEEAKLKSLASLREQIIKQVAGRRL